MIRVKYDLRQLWEKVDKDEGDDKFSWNIMRLVWGMTKLGQEMKTRRCKSWTPSDSLGILLPFYPYPSTRIRWMLRTCHPSTQCPRVYGGMGPRVQMIMRKWGYELWGHGRESNMTHVTSHPSSLATLWHRTIESSGHRIVWGGGGCRDKAVHHSSISLTCYKIHHATAMR